ncbi:Hypothetical predicted protein [Paramuricea clavata]|uniref:Uncharacterized protein n=1 Tax=Paramuricea clavata TaxID=317549 RepID=A0A6S7GYB3_PARCT|nr:Hypothetical predicted protein [Paramuricea clavata]
MTKTKSRKTNVSAKQAKKAKAVSDHTSDENGAAKEIEKAEKRQEILVHEEREKQLNCEENEKKDLIENNEEKNGREQGLGEKVRNVLKKCKMGWTSLGRVLVLIMVTILTCSTRYYNLKEPKHVW